MNKIMNQSFVKMSKQGIMGALLGIVAGFILGLLIWFLQFLLFIFSGMMDGAGINQVMQPPMMWLSAVMPATLGMAFGAIIGAIFGAISGLKNKKDE